MLKIAVVEDQTEVRESLCQFIRQYAGEQGLQAEVEPFADGGPSLLRGTSPGMTSFFWMWCPGWAAGRRSHPVGCGAGVRYEHGAVRHPRV